VKLIAGLGNPGRQYAHTRHNLGFVVLDELGERWNADPFQFESRFEALVAKAMVDDWQLLLIKPQTMMNLSGRAVASLMRFYKLATADLIVIYDDLDLPAGRIRVRAEGSGGGHRGMENVLLLMRTVEIPRIRVGIGGPRRGNVTSYVLGRPAPEQRTDLATAVQTAADATECWLRHGTGQAMNRYNRGD